MDVRQSMRPLGGLFWCLWCLRQRPESCQRLRNRAKIRGLCLKVLDDSLVLGRPAPVVIRAWKVAGGADEQVHPPMLVVLVYDSAIPYALSKDVRLDAEHVNRFLYRKATGPRLSGNPCSLLGLSNLLAPESEELILLRYPLRLSSNLTRRLASTFFALVPTTSTGR
jgi:hypothetical protein